ncbi:hypothetical protein EJB05_04235, partial [Eragrostis curvula]
MQHCRVMPRMGCVTSKAIFPLNPTESIQCKRSVLLTCCSPDETPYPPSFQDSLKKKSAKENMAKVPDLGSDFSKKLLKDLRRRRELLGFESAPAQHSTANVAPRDAYSSSQKAHQIQKPQQAAPRVRRSEATTNRLHRQGNNAISGAGKSRNHGTPPIAHSTAIVPYQGGGKPKPAAKMDVDMQMTLALALSKSGKLQLMESNGGNYTLSPSAHVGKVAIGVQKLNDILMAYSSGAGARGFGKKGSVEVGKQLLRGAMDLEESLSMLMMLQEASDYMESSGNGKLLLLEGKESRRSSSRLPSSARLVEIFDEDSEAELGNDAKGSSDASLQIVPFGKSQGSSANRRSVSEKDDSKVRMPNLIAKLMGLENLPSAKAVTERKATERFVRPDAVPRTNATFGTLPIRIVGSEGVPSKGKNKNLMATEWNISPTKSEESEYAPVLSNRSSHLRADKKTRQPMRQVLCKQESTDRRLSLTQVVDEKTIHPGMRLTEESKLQKTVGVGCHSDRKMNFLQRFRKNAKSKPDTVEKDIIQENKKKVGKMHATSVKQSLGIESEVQSRRKMEKLNKENLSSVENKAERNSCKKDQLRIPAQNKQNVEKRLQNYRQMQNKTSNQNLEHKRSLKSEPTHTKEKLEYTGLMRLKNGECAKADDTGGRKPSYNKPGDDGMFRQPAEERKDVSTTRGASSNQSEKQLPEETKDPTTAFAQSRAFSIAETTDDRVNQTASEAILMLETFSEGEQHQQQLHQTKDVNDPSQNDLDHVLKSGNPTELKNHKMHVVSCDSFTENQLLLTEMLLKDQYLLETAKTITGIHVPVSTVHVNTGKWLDKGNKVLSDIGREIIRRKGKRTEAMVDVSVKRPANLRLQTLDDLIRELDGDIQSLNIPMKPHQQSNNSTAENLKMILRSDIESTHSDANSMWDFGWNRMWDLPIEKNEVVKDLEKNILGSIITDVARELIDVSICHGFCTCEA